LDKKLHDIEFAVKNYITPNGFENLRKELQKLLNEDRPELVKVVSWAASNGDRSENGDYIYGKRKLREIDRRIRFLSKRLESSEIVDGLKQDPNRVLFGAKVLVQDEEERQRTYQIVGVDEIDPKKGCISWVSPIAKALLGSKVGDVVTFTAPGGAVELEVLKINY
jgi:transcription elongation factor GreB